MTWLCMKMADGRIGAARESEVVSLAMHPDHEHAKVRFADGSIDDVVSLHVVGSLGDVLPALVRLCHPELPPGAPSTLSPCGECILQDGEVCDVCGATNAALPCVEIEPPCEPDGFPAPTGEGTVDLARIAAYMEKAGIEPETSYARALRTKVCPHCSADIGSNIWDCPVCARSLDSEDAKGKLEAAEDTAKAEKMPGDDGECETCGRNHFSGDCGS
jgi:hypothetical protein